MPEIFVLDRVISYKYLYCDLFTYLDEKVQWTVERLRLLENYPNICCLNIKWPDLIESYSSVNLGYFIISVKQINFPLKIWGNFF